LLFICELTVLPHAQAASSNNDLLQGKGLFSNTETFGDQYLASDENVKQKNGYTYSVS